MMLLADISPSAVTFLQVLGVVLTLTLLTVTLAEVLGERSSRLKAYFALLTIDISLLLLYGILGPFAPPVSIFLKWLGIVLPATILIVLTSAYIRHRSQFPEKKQKRSRLRPLIATLVVACLLFFVVGIIGVWFGWLTSAQYVLAAGFAGSVASVIGLWSLARPSFQQEDLAALEPEYLKRIAEASEEIKKLDLAKAAAKQQIGSLEEQKRQMELLVQKVSLSLFLQEQRRLYEKRVKDEISANRMLLANLDELASIEQKLEALEEEIAKDPKVDMLQRIVDAARRTPEEISFSEYPPLTRSFLLLARDGIRAVARSLGR